MNLEYINCSSRPANLCEGEMLRLLARICKTRQSLSKASIQPATNSYRQPLTLSNGWFSVTFPDVIWSRCFPVVPLTLTSFTVQGAHFQEVDVKKWGLAEGLPRSARHWCGGLLTPWLVWADFRAAETMESQFEKQILGSLIVVRMVVVCWQTSSSVKSPQLKC